MALLANLLAQLGIVCIGAGFAIVWMWPTLMELWLGVEALGFALEAASALVERRVRVAT